MGHVTIVPFSDDLLGLVVRFSSVSNLKSLCTLYEDMKGDEKCKKWGGFGLRIT